MSVDNLKNLLCQYREICGYIYDLAAEKELLSAAESIKSAALKDKIDMTIEKLCSMREIIEQSLDNADDMTQKRVLYLKYLRGMTNEKIALRCGYSERQIARIVNRGLTSVAEKSSL